jgi:glucuronate isomerase
MARRLDAGFLAQLVAEGRLDEGKTVETAIDLVATTPRNAFRL